jgi:Pvc16 N-terminal domain
MSNSLAIAAVTTTLRYLLQRRFDSNGSGNVTVTTKPPDKARDNNGNATNQVNLFLYQTKENAAWRNMDIPNQVKPGETGQPPLALNLYYMLTAYAQNDDFPEPTSHSLLGEAMSVFYDFPVLRAEDIKNALPAADVTKYDLYNQIERVKITPQSLSLDELSKMWTTFQTQYRISTAYEVSVVLIESTRPLKTPLPVLSRSSGDTGVTTQPEITPPYPILLTVNFTAIEQAREDLPAYQKKLLQKPAANLGDELTLTGYNLEGNVEIVFNNPQLTTPNIITIPATARTATEIQLTIDSTQPDKWCPGLYSVTAIIEDRSSNGLPLPVAPTIKNITFNSRDNSNPNKPNNVIVQVRCNPPVLPAQRVSLVLSTQEAALVGIGDRELVSRNHPIQTDTLEFELGDISAGTYQVRPRLRVDGVDSLVVNYNVTPLVLPLSLIPEIALVIS